MNNEQSDFRDLQFVDLRLQINKFLQLKQNKSIIKQNMLESTNILDFDKIAKKA